LSETEPTTEAPEETAEATPELPVGDEIITLNVANDTLQTLSVSQRRIGLRLLPYNTVAVHPKYGALLFEPGAFVGADLGPVDPKQVRLRMDHEDPPTGLGDKYVDNPDAPYLEALVSKTARGDDQLTLAADGVSRGASVGYSPIPGRSKSRRIDGQSVTVFPPASAILAEVSTTWQPTFADAGVMYVLSRDEKGSGPMAEAQEAPTNGVDYDKLTEAIVTASAKANGREEKIEKLLAKHEELIELQRSQFNLPAAAPAKKANLTDWVGVALRTMAGEHISHTELVELALDDVIISEQPGLVPDVFTADYDDLINRDRPFLQSTREIAPPRTGTTMTLPVITVRAVSGTQAGNAEKGALTTTATKVGTGSFTYASIFGGADISIQFINRADPSFFDLLTGDMAMAYALDADGKAITALLAGYTDSGSVTHEPTDGGVLDPEDPNFGEAWENAITSTYRRAPDTIWLSAAAVGAFIDAKAPITNAPLYSNLAASFTAGGGPGGTLSGLRPIYVPAMDTSAVDVIVGPSRGFVWAEDPARTLSADVPSVAGRDIALVGGLFPAPRYADAFTTYTIAS
jgi:phage head maturation protease